MKKDLTTGKIISRLVKFTINVKEMKKQDKTGDLL